MITTLEDLGIYDKVQVLSARVLSDVEYIQSLPDLGDFLTVVIDDFHRLPVHDQNRIADLLKVLANTESRTRKLVIVGINQAGVNLINFAPDLANRIDRIRFESEPDSKIHELIEKGEAALNIKIAAAERGLRSPRQLLPSPAPMPRNLHPAWGSGEAGRARPSTNAVFVGATTGDGEAKSCFGLWIKAFARGTRFRTYGRANYYHILRWLAESSDWSIDLAEEMNRHPNQKFSVKQVVDKGHLARLCSQTDIAAILVYNEDAKSLSVEDPHVMYYLKNLDWPEFVRDIGFTNIDVQVPYDIALSFAGEDRDYAEQLHVHLEEYELAVFYDKAEESRILAGDVEAILGPSTRKDCRYVVAVLGERYGVKRWTLFEASKYSDRIEKGEVIPIWSNKIPPSAFDEMRKRGGMV